MVADFGRKISGKVLVVDDDATQCAVIGRMLSMEHDVVTLTSAQDALERILSGERFDVMLCDLMMHDLTGMDLHAEVSRLVPDQAERMVFMTGGAFTRRARDFLERIEIRCIQKPFNTQQVIDLVRSLLD